MIFQDPRPMTFEQFCERYCQEPHMRCMVLEFKVKGPDGTEIGLEVGDAAHVFIGPYRAQVGLRELRALEVAVNMAIDELERRKKESA